MTIPWRSSSTSSKAPWSLRSSRREESTTSPFTRARFFSSPHTSAILPNGRSPAPSAWSSKEPARPAAERVRMVLLRLQRAAAPRRGQRRQHRRRPAPPLRGVLPRRDGAHLPALQRHPPGQAAAAGLGVHLNEAAAAPASRDHASSRGETSDAPRERTLGRPGGRAAQCLLLHSVSAFSRSSRIILASAALSREWILVQSRSPSTRRILA